MWERADLAAPACPHVIVASDGLAISHEAKVHGRADEITVKCQVHAAHGEERPLQKRWLSVMVLHTTASTLMQQVGIQRKQPQQRCRAQGPDQL